MSHSADHGILTPLAGSIAENPHLPHASSLCGACKAACRWSGRRWLSRLRHQPRGKRRFLAGRKCCAALLSPGTAWRCWPCSLQPRRLARRLPGPGRVGPASRLPAAAKPFQNGGRWVVEVGRSPIMAEASDFCFRSPARGVRLRRTASASARCRSASGAPPHSANRHGIPILVEAPQVFIS